MSAIPSKATTPVVVRRGSYESEPDSCRARLFIRSPRKHCPEVRLKLLADDAVNRIRTAAADGDDEAYRADQQHILISAATGCITLRQMHENQSHQHLDGQRGCEKSSEQTDDQADSADRLEEHDDVCPY